MSVREVDNNELSAINSLKKNVTFWFNECGLSKEGVLREIESWFNFAFTTKEQNEAKREVINLLNKTDVLKEGGIRLLEQPDTVTLIPTRGISNVGTYAISNTGC
ncbi:hypothetical protein QNH14_23915 (plasmid) [Apirhabdus apintestini]|nr:hypothetical protein QNH14_23915 [Enterobacteriaceae bacterium CA-0114]